MRRRGDVRARSRRLARGLVLGATRTRATRTRGRHGRRRPAHRGTTAGLERYAELVADALADRDDDVILVGHSLGGATIPLVPRLRPARHLVFLCSLLPRPGASVDDRFEAEDVFAPGYRGNTAVRDDGASYWPDPEAATRFLFNRSSAADARWATARLRPQSGAPQREAWPADVVFDLERTSIVCRDDRCIDPGWSRTMSREQLGVEPIELDGDHSPFLARAAELADVLSRLA